MSAPPESVPGGSEPHDLVALKGVAHERMGGISDELYFTIVRLLELHMLRERVEDIDGILETLVAEPQFVMEHMPLHISNRWWWSRKVWRGRDAVIAFYNGLFKTFQSFRVDVFRYTVSPKGVVDAYRVGGRVWAQLLNIPRLGIRGIPVTLTMAAFLPYDPVERKLRGEHVYFREANALENL